MPDRCVLGPAFDTNTLIRPTQRKIVTAWMEDAGCRTLVLPEVWAELVKEVRTRPRSRQGLTAQQRWHAIREVGDSPFLFVELTPEQDEAAEEIRSLFTQSCFPHLAADEITTASDSVIISQALAIGTDYMVTSDTGTIDHDEVNHIAQSALGRNAGFITTLDAALPVAYAGGEAAERLLVLALSTVAPAAPQLWPVDDAKSALDSLTKAMVSAGMPRVAQRLMVRWEQAKNLEGVLQSAVELSREGMAMTWERRRSALGWDDDNPHAKAARRA